jgi:hypothetical protein
MAGAGDDESRLHRLSHVRGEQVGTGTPRQRMRTRCGLA